MPLFAFGVSRVVWVERGKTEKGDGMKRERVYRLFLKVEGEEGLAQSDTSCHPCVAFRHVLSVCVWLCSFSVVAFLLFFVAK